MNNPFSIPVAIREAWSFAECAETFELNEDDLILTSEHTYTRSIEKLGLPCKIIFREKYGTGEPTDEMVDAIHDALTGIEYERIVAVGGGTIIDIAKALAVAGPDDTMDRLYDRMPDLTRDHGLIVVPTTCGTGSEMTDISVISRIRKGVKQGLVSPAMYPDEAVLIADLLETLPYSAFGTSSVDAMVHAVESYLSPNSCQISEMFSAQALRIILRCWKQTLQDGGDDAWKTYAADFLRASSYAGIAFGYAGCAAVHALSYPVGSVHHVPHGQSNQMMFADVMRKYKEKKPVGKLNRLEELVADILEIEADSALESLYSLMDEIYKKDRLSEHGITMEELEEFSQNVLETQQRLLKNNYVKLDYEDILEIYRNAY